MPVIVISPNSLEFELETFCPFASLYATPHSSFAAVFAPHDPGSDGI